MSELITQPANVFDVNIGTLRVTRGQNIIRVNDNVLTCTGDAVSAVEQNNYFTFISGGGILTLGRNNVKGTVVIWPQGTAYVGEQVDNENGSGGNVVIYNDGRLITPYNFQGRVEEVDKAAGTRNIADAQHYRLPQEIDSLPSLLINGEIDEKAAKEIMSAGGRIEVSKDGKEGIFAQILVKNSNNEGMMATFRYVSLHDGSSVPILIGTEDLGPEEASTP